MLMLLRHPLVLMPLIMAVLILTLISIRERKALEREHHVIERAWSATMEAMDGREKAR